MSNTLINTLIEKSIETVTGNLHGFLSSLEDDERIDAKICIEAISSEAIKLALTDNEKEKQVRERNILHYKNALMSIQGSAEIKAYNMTIKTIGDVLGAVVVGGVSALL